jgi:hypothetical protein
MMMIMMMMMIIIIIIIIIIICMPCIFPSPAAGVTVTSQTGGSWQTTCLDAVTAPTISGQLRAMLAACTGEKRSNAERTKYIQDQRNWTEHVIWINIPIINAFAFRSLSVQLETQNYLFFCIWDHFICIHSFGSHVSGHLNSSHWRCSSG